MNSMTDYIRYSSAGYGDSSDNNAKEVCDWIHSRIYRKNGHGAERVFWCGDNTIVIQMISEDGVAGQEIPVPLGSYVAWMNEEDDFAHGHFEVISAETRETELRWKLMLGESINGTRNDVKDLISKASGRDSREFAILCRVEELLGSFDAIMNILAETLPTEGETS